MDKLYYEWPRGDERGLARYIQPDDLPAEFKLPMDVNRLDVLVRQGAKGLAVLLYQHVCDQNIQYDLAPFNPRIGIVQSIRKPNTILAEKRSTSLDLVILLAAMCLDNDLLPLVVLVDGHAFIGLSLLRTRRSDKKAPQALAWDKGQLTDLSVLQELAGTEYLFIECTGAAASRALSDTFPEGRGREKDGRMSFERACEAGREQLLQHARLADGPADPNQRTFLYALDINDLQIKQGFEPIGEDYEGSKTRSQTNSYPKPKGEKPVAPMSREGNIRIQEDQSTRIRVGDQAQESVDRGADDSITKVNDIQQTIYLIAQRALSDCPIDHREDDLLGFSIYANALANFILDEHTDKPLTIAIDAPWGMGKSSLMNLIHERLSNGEKKPILVKFNAWKYDKEEALWASLALTITSAMAMESDWWKRWWKAFKLNSQRFDGAQFLRDIRDALLTNFLALVFVFLIVVALLILLGRTLEQALLNGLITVGMGGGLLGAVVYGKKLFTDIAAFLNLKVDRYMHRPNYHERVGFIAEFQTDLEKIIDVVTEGGRKFLVVFIDDVDRCAVGRAVEVMEAINLFLDQKHCVFVIGMDSRTVAASIEARYEKLKDILNANEPNSLEFGRRFLEKIVQINFRMPPVDKNTFQHLITGNLQQSQLSIPVPQPAVQEIKRAIKQELSSGETSLSTAAQKVEVLDPAQTPDIKEAVKQEALQEILEQNFDQLPEVQEAVAVAVPYLDFNPRRVKRFINLFRLQAYIANSGALLNKGAIKLDGLAKWLLIAMLWPDFIQRISIDDKFDDKLIEARQLKHDLDSGNYLAKEAQNEAEAALNQFMTDPVLKEFLNTDQLANLINDLGIAQMTSQQINTYLRLVTTTREATRTESNAPIQQPKLEDTQVAA